MTAAASDAVETSRSRRHTLLLTLLLLVSAFVQLTVVNRTEVDTPLRADAAEYFSYAFNLREFGVFSSAPTWREAERPPPPAADKIRSPGYPWFLAAIARPRADPDFLHLVSLWQAAFGVVSVLLTYLIAAKVLSRPWALAAATLTAVNPHLATISTYLLTESLFTMLLLAAVLSTMRAWPSGDARKWAISGVAWSVCCLVRPTMQFLPLLLLIGTWIVPGWGRYRRGTLICLAAFALVLAPWTLRNANVPATPGASLMANSIAHGSYPGFMHEDRPESFGFPYRFDPDYPQYSQSLRGVLSDVAERASEHPMRYLGWYAAGKPGWFLSWGNVQAVDVLIYPVLRSPYYEERAFAALRGLSLALHWPLMLSGVAGMLWLLTPRRWAGSDTFRRDATVLIAVVVAYAIALHMVVAPFPRYSIPFRPLLFVLALLAMRAAWLAIGARRGASGSVTSSN